MSQRPPNDAESRRLRDDAARRKNWKRWGPYLAERQWGTVREDYSAEGAAWSYFPHDQARSRAYRWGEDGLLGFCDRQCRLCFALALWNGRDPILKERLFGLSNHEGNHGEDVKELYYYLDSTPTHSYVKGLYQYPQAAFPYERLVEENARRGKDEPEFELADTGVFDEDRYFDVVAEYAKAAPNDVLIRVTVTNRGPEAARLDLLPTLWFRNTWVWGCRHEGCTLKPRMEVDGDAAVRTDHETLGRFVWHVDRGPGGDRPPLLMTENETNTRALYGTEQYTPYVKDGFHRYVIERDAEAVSPKGVGTKAAAHYRLELGAGESATVRMRLHAEGGGPARPFHGFDTVFDRRIAEADGFYQCHLPKDPEAANVARRAYAGLLWSKQFYHYIVPDWLDGDPGMPPPPPQRRRVRNADWTHLYSRDVLSMPDKWEYPWFAAWDTAFHMVALARVDPDFAKKQLILFLREWYMHPNGQIPAYEFNLSDVNPPVHAWACWRVYKITAPRGRRDRVFLASAFQKLLLNFTWWFNRKDPSGRHLFAGGFLGLDNIGVFDRSQPLPDGTVLQQADGTAWMAFYCATMLAMALELAETDPEYEDMASKFFEHFVAIADAINHLGGTGLWSTDDGFYYDLLRTRHPDGSHENQRIRIRSLVGLLPLIAVEALPAQTVQRRSSFAKRARWFLENRKDLQTEYVFTGDNDHDKDTGHRDGVAGDHVMLALATRDRLEHVLRYMLDESEFLSPHGVRSLSKCHEREPFVLPVDGREHRVRYTPGESDTDLFGGNSNWRGPVWFPINYLLIEALERYHRYYGDSLRVECPTGSGRRLTLLGVADELRRRLASLFLPDADGRRPCFGDTPPPGAADPDSDRILFHEYFHGETGRGLGASHQTGWTALVARCLDAPARFDPPTPTGSRRRRRPAPVASQGDTT